MKVIEGAEFDALAYLIVAKIKGKEIDVTHTSYFVYHDNACIDIHVSQIIVNEGSYKKILAFGKTLKLIGK